jgi:hypothetical protein
MDMILSYIYICRLLHLYLYFKQMDETCCFAYNEISTINMEEFLYHDEYADYNEDSAGRHQLDLLIYYQLFGCD